MTTDVKQCAFVVNELKGVTQRAKELSTKLNERVNNLNATLDMVEKVHGDVSAADDELRAALCTETNGPPTGAH